jgi:hypothetical protein
MGHSYGAFMTANLLAHSDLFSAGIVRSGACNRNCCTDRRKSRVRRTKMRSKRLGGRHGNLAPLTALRLNGPRHVVHLPYPLLLARAI